MIILLSPLWAQDAATGSSGFQLFDLLTRLGIAGVFIYMWWMERTERRESQARERTGLEQQAEMLERMLPIVTEATSALRAMNKIQEGLTERAAHVTERAAQITGTELTDLLAGMDALSEELRTARHAKG